MLSNVTILGWENPLVGKVLQKVAQNCYSLNGKGSYEI